MGKKIGVHIKLDVMKIDKARLFSGKKGKYLDATVFIDVDEEDEYGNNGMVTQDVSKEEREGGVKGPILGNCSVFWKDDGTTNQDQPREQRSTTAPRNTEPVNKSAAAGFDDFDDDIPF